jgi:hypothetical protein
LFVAGERVDGDSQDTGKWRTHRFQLKNGLNCTGYIEVPLNRRISLIYELDMYSTLSYYGSGISSSLPLVVTVYIIET